MELSEIKKQYEELGQAYKDAEGGKITYFQADGLRNRFNYESVSYVGTLLATIDQQQAEIERLRAALQEIASGERSLPYGTTDYSHSELQVIAKEALGQQQPEPPQESLKVQILRILARSEKGIMFPMIAEKVPSSQTSVSRELGYLMHDGLADRIDAFRYNITSAGRDYLASLDAMNKPTIETTEGYLSQLD